MRYQRINAADDVIELRGILETMQLIERTGGDTVPIHRQLDHDGQLHLVPIALGAAQGGVIRRGHRLELVQIRGCQHQ